VNQAVHTNPVKSLPQAARHSIISIPNGDGAQSYAPCTDARQPVIQQPPGCQDCKLTRAGT
jgi:hypothetical protein